jgi:hypothetical protein
MEECGYTVPITNPDQMASDIADILCKLAQEREKIRTMGVSARKRIMDSYNENQFLEVMNRIYAAAIF